MNNLERSMQYEWDNPPAPFNPLFDKNAKKRAEKVVSSMVEDCFYDNHTREQCKNEYASRYELLKNNGQ